jgi:hypothetical protein
MVFQHDHEQFRGDIGPGIKKFHLFSAALPPYFGGMFESIKDQITSAGEKLQHLRRFL